MKKQTQNPLDHRKILHEWETPEFIPMPRGKRWYFGASATFLLLMAYAAFTHSLTMILVFIMLAIVFFLLEKREPKMVKVQITDLGLIYKDNFYPFHHINAFWMVYHPPHVQALYLKIRKGKRLEDLKIELFHENPAEIRNHLIHEIPEIEGASEPLTDLLARILRLQ